jgi:FAD/FMN-containing dehydrogenase
MSDTIKALTETVRGRVIIASDPDYDDARAVYNAMHDRRPQAVVQCADSADVMAVIAAARDRGVDLAIRGGGHSVPGFGTVDDGLVIDLSPMKGVRVDPAKKVAWVGGGATWGDVDHATYPFGLAAPGGVVSTTGVAGLTLGGGIGYLTRSVGLSIDNLLSADVILADGRQVTASDYQNEDLFWALRGGGGNFGVVTGFEFWLHKVGDVVAARCSTTSTMPRRSWSATAPSSTRRPSSWDASSAGRSRLRCRSSPRTGSGICSACWSRAGTVPMRRPSRCSGHFATSPR